MPVQTVAQRNALADAYGAAAPNGALFTGAGPGGTGAADNEVTGGSPAYGRLGWGWGAAAGSAINGAATPFDVPSGVTVTFIGVTVSAVAGTADVRDFFDSVDQTFASQGVYTVTPTYTQS